MKSLTARDISAIFKDHEFKWSFTEGLKVPTEGDISEFMKNLNKTLDSRDATMIESGRILIKKDQDGHTDVYINVGEIKEII